MNPNSKNQQQKSIQLSQSLDRPAFTSSRELHPSHNIIVFTDGWDAYQFMCFKKLIKIRKLYGMIGG